MTRIYEIRFTKEEAQAVVTLISRADIKGGEAPAVVQLMSKFQPLLKPDKEEKIDTSALSGASPNNL